MKKPAYKHLIALLLLAFALSIVAIDSAVASSPALQQATCTEAILHYRRRNADYEDWGLHVWGPNATTGVTWTSPFMPTDQDDYGLIWAVPMQDGAEFLNYIVHKEDEKDPGPDQTMTFADVGCDIWLTQGKEEQFTDEASAIESMDANLIPAPTVGENQVLIHYRRTRADYDGWGLHIWGPTTIDNVTWTEPLMPAGQDDYGVFWLVDMEADADHLNYIVHYGDEKDPGPDQTMLFDEVGREIWLIQGSGMQYLNPDEAKAALIALGVGDIVNKAEAFWLARNIIGWPVEWQPGAQFTLHYSTEGTLQLTPNGMEGGDSIPLSFVMGGLPDAIKERFPHLRLSLQLIIEDEYLDLVPDILRGQFAITAHSPEGTLIRGTTLQIPGVLDNMYYYDGPLGVTWDGEIPTIRVWAPTARNVSFLLFDTGATNVPALRLSMDRDDATGVWSITGDASWKNKYYLYEVDVFVRVNGKFETNLVTDPYSFSLATNSAKSQIVDLNDPALKPDGWDTFTKPEFGHPTDIVLYELHVRDFSARDETISADARGTFKAFTYMNSNGMQHLQSIASAGVTHVHLLPVFDIATIDENKANWVMTDFAALSQLPPDSSEQQAFVNQNRDKDPFNWGYDPHHFTVPEGSYSTDPEGTARIREFREMVMALSDAGMRVVMDVVYNHTNASGQSERSVFDRIVPGYYHRLNRSGVVENSTCCENTATEHLMMEKLMVDSLVTWVTMYKVDGFRFDLMGHHMKSNMLNVQEALGGLTVANDGVDGSEIYLYGEGWDFGEVQGNLRGVNATQLNMGGTGIGAFNDRIRDGARGGSPFGGTQEQGFINGLFTNPNEVETRPASGQLDKLLQFGDWIMIGLAGNLLEYQFIGASGREITGRGIDYNGSPAGYTRLPQEHISYVSAHDNETLFDGIQFKAPLTTPMSERIRMQQMGLSLVALGQGVPFFHAGDEILRSKSFDRDSYNSGDWFNAIDWTYNDNNWGIGLPPEEKNRDKWDLMRTLLSNPDLQASQEDILLTKAIFEEMLQIRKSSPLFRMQTAEQVKDQLSFLNTGPDQVPGLIVMHLADKSGMDANYASITVFFNARPEAVTFSIGELAGKNIQLHPIQVGSSDARVLESAYETDGSFTVPAMTTAVFVELDTGVEPQLPTEVPAQIDDPSSSEEPPSGTGGLLIWAAGVGAVALGAGAYFASRRRKSKE